MKQVHVAVGVVINDKHEVLIAKRHSHQHQGGLWEFPGGKVEPGETTFSALKREFKEEVNLDLIQSESLLVVEHDYGDKQVKLDTLVVKHFSGIAVGLEAQEVKWVKVNELTSYEFPKANEVILDAIKALNLNAGFC